MDRLALTDEELQGHPVPLRVEDHAGAVGDAAPKIRLVRGVLQQPVPHGLDLHRLAPGIAAVAIDAAGHHAADEQKDKKGSQQGFHAWASSLNHPS